MNKLPSILAIALLLPVVLFQPKTTHAQEAQILSVTPPLFQLSVLPGGIWQSSVKVVNANPYPLTVYAEVVNFQGMGSGGQGQFIPVLEDDEKTTFAEWITITRGPHIIPPEQTADITFFAEIPENAAPGGHYAAILISTEEPKKSDSVSVLTSQVVTSLLFLRVEGDVHEEGAIREFRTEHTFLNRPETEFLLRFENKGNVHILPRGDITITNMWGKERGVIPINNKSNYGNVLPESVRNFTFLWKSDFTFADIGRYKAEVTLGYGEDGIKNVSSATYFWVIPVKWTLITLSVLALFFWLIMRMVRAYVRRMLTLAGVNPDEVIERTSVRATPELYMRRGESYRNVSAPIRDGVIDLRTRLSTHTEDSVLATVWNFVRSYKWFFLSLGALIAMFVSISFYIGTATRDGASYEVRVLEDDGTSKVISNTP